jgi:hypothetical protein
VGNRRRSPGQALINIAVAVGLLVFGLRFTGGDKSFTVLWCAVLGVMILSNLWVLLVLLRGRRSARRGVVYTTERHHRRGRER